MNLLRILMGKIKVRHLSPFHLCIGNKVLGKPWKIKFDNVCTEVDIFYAFRLILGRTPSEQEWEGHRTQAGNKLSDIIASYIGSMEFNKRRLIASNAMKYTLVNLERYKIYVSPSDTAVGVHIYNGKIYEPHVTKIIETVLMSGMSFLDIGANIGYFSMLAAHIVGNKGRVYAFEPFQNNVKLLYHSADINRFSQISIFPFALSNENELLLYSNEASNGRVDTISDIDMSLSSDMVYAVKLDDFLQIDCLDVVKIDVEGAEYLALTGAKKLLEKYCPIIVSEFSPPALNATSGVSPEEYLTVLLVNDDYKLAVISEQGTLIKVGRDISKIIRYFHNAKTDHIDIIAYPKERQL